MATDTTNADNSALGGPHTQALSRHGGGLSLRWNVQACNLNAWCHIPGSPFASGFVLMPNRPAAEPVSVVFGPVAVPAGLDTFSGLFSSGLAPHGNRLAITVQVLDSSYGVLAESTALVAHGDRRGMSLRFAAPLTRKVALRFSLSFAHFAGGPAFGSAHVDYLLAYKDNPLVSLFNACGSDKGTEARSGDGVPHCYALDYYELFRPLRHRHMNILEIGLDNASKSNGRPTRAPSLAVWREFFPNATIYGYDINDFSFLKQRGTYTFRGDQGSPVDLERFLTEYGRPRFGLILDDGSHATSHQQTSLVKLLPNLEPGGLYIIEDLNWQPFDEGATTIDMLRRFLADGSIRSPFIARADARALEESIADVTIHKPNDAEFAVIRTNA